MPGQPDAGASHGTDKPYGSDPLDLDLRAPGTVPSPGPIGRLVRLAWGLFLLLAIDSVWSNRDALIGERVPLVPSWWLGMIVLLAVFPYVVNIGFGVDWKSWPRRLVLVLLAVVGAIGFVRHGTPWSPELGGTLVIWQLYTMSHLGGSFLLAALIGTPGCEMRALPHLWTLVTGRSTREHFCPGHIDAVDRWERRRRGAAATATADSRPENTP